MKKLLLLATAALFSVSVFAQKKIEVRESNEKIGGGNHNALVVMIYVDDKGDVEKAWKSKLKDMDAKVSSKDDIFADEAKLKAMGPNTFDVYSRAEMVKGEGVKLIVGVDLGGAFMSSSQHSGQFKVFKELLYEFAVKLTKEKIGAEVAAQEKALEKLEDQQKSLEKENSDLKSDIENYKKKIAEAEDKIKKNEGDQKTKKGEIEAQQKVVATVKEKMNAVK